MSTRSRDEQELKAKDSPRRLFRFFCAVCWIAWMLVTVLTVWALYQSNGHIVPFEREQILASFWWVSYFCAGLPLAVWVLMWWVERRSP